MKLILLFLAFFIQWTTVQAQIISTTTSPSQKKVKSGDSSSVFYLDFQRFNTHPNLSQNTSFLTVPLGERANESSLKVWSYQFGLCSPIAKHFSFDGGLALIQSGEQYSWESSATDSSYRYDTKYRYFGMPLQVKYQTGKDLVFFMGAGLVPQLFQSYEQDISWTDSLGNAGKQTLNDESMCQSFVLSAMASAGLQLHFKSNYGLRFSLYYRYQLTNSYGPYQYFKHYSSGIGGGISLTRKL
jgi:hypothetical protein